jgi:O-6-methylguanine DNA methyltransferase
MTARPEEHSELAESDRHLETGSVECRYGTVHYVAEEGRLIYCGFRPWDSPGSRIPLELKRRISRASHAGEAHAQPENTGNADDDRAIGRMIRSYLEGPVDGLNAVMPPMSFYGTEFQRSVWKAMLDIPFGKVATYGEIAAAIGRPRAVRAVGSAVGTNPLAPVVPCHRVLPAGGGIGNYGGGVEKKRFLLSIEGALPGS